MNISISGQHDVPDLPSGTRVVVALSPTEHRDINPDLLRPGYLWLPMEDTEDWNDRLAPSDSHLDRLQHYALAAIDAPLHIACWMGVSRSTALAAYTLALTGHSSSDREIADEVRLIRPQAAPNRLLLELIDERFARNLSRQFQSLEAYD